MKINAGIDLNAISKPGVSEKNLGRLKFVKIAYTVVKWWQFKIFKDKYVLNSLLVHIENPSHQMESGK